MNLLIRADGGGTVGAGHLMRCLALAQAERDRADLGFGRGRAAFAIPRRAEAMAARLAMDAELVEWFDEPTGSMADADRSAALASRLGADCLVLDGYSFGPSYRRRLRESGWRGRLIVIDDEGKSPPYDDADAVINPNLGADESLYPPSDRASRTRLFLGSRHALFRREFRQAKVRSRSSSSSSSGLSVGVRRIVVTLGASDPDNATCLVIEALRAAGLGAGVQVDVILGAWHPDPSSVATALGDRMTLHRDVEDMTALLGQADLAIIGGGSTLWECARFGTPPLALILAENQRPGASRAADRGIAVLAGDASSLTAESLADRIRDLTRNASAPLLRDLSRKGRQAFDGQGASRILATLDAPLRPVMPSDRERIFDWVNDPITRAAAFAPDPVPWETHVAWFAARLNDPRCWFYIGLDPKEQPAACVRFDDDDDNDDDDDDPHRNGQTTISIMVAPEFRGQGLGQSLIRAGAELMLNVNSANQINAYIRPDNPASIRTFERAGFQRAAQEPIPYRGRLALHYTCK